MSKEEVQEALTVTAEPMNIPPQVQTAIVTQCVAELLGSIDGLRLLAIALEEGHPFDPQATIILLTRIAAAIATLGAFGLVDSMEAVRLVQNRLLLVMAPQPAPGTQPN